MSDALTPLRQVYGLEPDAPASGAGSPEHEGLRVMREVLDAAPSVTPSPQAIATICARAAEARREVEEIPARGAAEAAVLAQSLRALDRLPKAQPDASVITAIQARAAQASDALAAVRHVYTAAAAPALGIAAATEAQALRPLREAIERTLASRPQPRPSAGVTDAILARAAEPLLETEEIPADGWVEAAVLAQSLRALDRLPRPQPSVRALEAIRSAAATATAAEVPASPSRPVAAVASGTSRRRPVGVWAGASALLLAALVAVVLIPRGSESETEPVTLALADASAPSATPDAEPLEAAFEPFTSEPLASEAPAAAPQSSPLVASAGIAGLAPTVERRPASTPPATSAQPVAFNQPAASARTPAVTPAPPRALTTSPSAPLAATASRAAARATAPAWDATDDVRALSLRLQELDDEALAWDEPSETFGAPAPSSLTSTPGVRSVRAAAPARARMLAPINQ